MTVAQKRILLTGGAGFIGTALARRLVDHNQVVVYDNRHRNSLKDSELLSHSNLRVIWGDVLEAEAVREAVRGCQIVVHLVAISGVDVMGEAVGRHQSERCVNHTTTREREQDE